MAVRDRFGKLKPLNNQELILKGDQKAVIREILKDKVFALLEISSERSEITSKRVLRYVDCSSLLCAIRSKADNKRFICCDYFLCINNREGNGKENLQRVLDYRRSDLEERKPNIEMKLTFPVIDEFLSFMEDKELVFNDYYRDYGGDTEGIYRKYFLDIYLRIKASKLRDHLIYDEFYDVRIFITRIGNDPSLSVDKLTAADVRNFDIDSLLHEYLREKTTGYYCNSSFDYDFDLEAQSDMAKASYFVKQFHGIHWYNHERHHDPEGRLCYRFSVFILPGIVPVDEAKALSEDKRAFNFVDGTEYKIDSIHINTEICSDISEFKDWIEYDLEAMEED